MTHPIEHKEKYLILKREDGNLNLYFCVEENGLVDYKELSFDYKDEKDSSIKPNNFEWESVLQEKLVFETRLDAEVYFSDNIFQPLENNELETLEFITKRYEGMFNQWLSEEKPIIKEDLKDK